SSSRLMPPRATVSPTRSPRRSPRSCSRPADVITDVPSPALAAVVVAYNSAGELPATLAALRAQLGPADELVVVDNRSSDGSGAVAGAAGATVIETGSNAGFAAACHAGVRATSAPLVFFCNPDAEVHPGCVDALRAADPRWGAWQALVTLAGGREIN